jgi:hypothetical protein
VTRQQEVTSQRYQRYLFLYRKQNGEPLPERSQHIRLMPVRVRFRWLVGNHVILSHRAVELVNLPVGHVDHKSEAQVACKGRALGVIGVGLHHAPEGNKRGCAGRCRGIRNVTTRCGRCGALFNG